MKKIAIIDLGSNTFHIQIVSLKSKTGFKILFKKRVYVKLADQGINKIGAKAYARGIQCLQSFKEVIEKHQVTQIRAIGTATFRKAVNALEFVKTAYKKCGLKIEIISGNREAELICKGVALFNKKVKLKNYLIIDIGGGSVELIWLKSNKIIFSQSFEIGVSILKNKFHHTDPLTEQNLEECTTFILRNIAPFLNFKQNEPIEHVYGASGSFEVLQNAIQTKNKSKIGKSDFFQFFEKIIHLDLKERLKIKSIPENRADLIIVAMILIKTILEVTNAKEISISDFALKEGIIAEYLAKL